MKLYIGKNQLLLTGKAWEIKHLLHEYSNQYKYVRQCINHEHAPTQTITHEN